MLSLEGSWSYLSHTHITMFPILLSTILNTADAPQNYLPPQDEPSYQVCIDMEHDLEQGVEFGYISTDQMHQILIRCYINYQ